MNPKTKPENYDKISCWLCEKAFKTTKRCSKCKNEGLPICKEKLC